MGQKCIGKYGYSSLGAVVGATFPQEATNLRKIMPNSFFLVPGFGAQGGTPDDIVPCFNNDGLGAVISSSRAVLYKHLEIAGFDHSREMYKQIVRQQATDMQQTIYRKLKETYKTIVY